MKNNINLRSILALIMAIAVMSTICINLVGCSDSGSGSSSTTKETISESKAIAIAKDSSRVQNAIAEKYSMKFFYTPDWGTCTATQKSDGSWEVVLKGNISGYTDDHKTNFIYDKKFTAEVTIGSSGYVGYVSVKTN